MYPPKGTLKKRLAKNLFNEAYAMFFFFFFFFSDFLNKSICCRSMQIKWVSIANTFINK